MVPPIGTTPITPENVNDLTDAEIDIILNSNKTKERIKTNLMEKEREDSLYEHDFGNLLHKAFMTPLDKENMKKAIKFLIDKKMDTPENFGKLEAIYYEQNFIEIGEVKRARENFKAEPDGKNIFEHGNEVYFTFSALKEQKKRLSDRGMKIPRKDDFVKALKALPGEDHLDSNGYVGANILGTILDLTLFGYCNSTGKLIDKNVTNGVGSLPDSGSNDGAPFLFSVDVCLQPRVAEYAFAVRPIVK